MKSEPSQLELTASEDSAIFRSSRATILFATKKGGKRNIAKNTLPSGTLRKKT